MELKRKLKGIAQSFMKSRAQSDSEAAISPKESERDFIQSNINMIELDENGDKISSPTNCYGRIEFEETTNKSNAKFIRISDKTEPEKIFHLMTEHWGLKPPKLLISVTGGASLNISDRLRRDFQEGLLKVANTPDAWVVSGGTNTGVMKLVGDANYGTKNISIGIVTWGVIAKREVLSMENTLRNRCPAKSADSEPDVEATFPYHAGSSFVNAGQVSLDINHSHFLLVDDGSCGKFGGEIEFRGRFEEYIRKSSNREGEKTHGASVGSDIHNVEPSKLKHVGEEEKSKKRIPTVLLVLDGGPGTLDTIFNTSVENDIPCVLVQGSNRVADLLVNSLNNREKIEQCETEGKTHDNLYEQVKGIGWNMKPEAVQKHYNTVLKCLKKPKLFTIANFQSGMDTDEAILTALLSDESSSPSHYDQMQLTILWDRVDLAQSKILSGLRTWVPRPETHASDDELIEEDEEEVVDCSEKKNIEEKGRHGLFQKIFNFIISGLLMAAGFFDDIWKKDEHAVLETDEMNSIDEVDGDTLRAPRVETLDEKEKEKRRMNKAIEKELHDLMIMSLALKRKNFVKLLMDSGVSMKSVLTKQVLEFLYGCCSSTLMRTNMKPNTIDEAREAILHLSSRVITSKGSREGKRIKENEALFKTILSYTGSKGSSTSVPLFEVQKRLSSLLMDTVSPEHTEKLFEIPRRATRTFKHPFRQLFLWAVLNNHLEMALFLWEFEDNGIALALLAAQITTATMSDPRFSQLQDEEERCIAECCETFKRLSVDLMDECYESSEKDTELLIINRLELFNGRSSCLELAVDTEQEDFVAHTAVQGILDAAWYGSIKDRDTSTFYIITAVFCPLMLMDMDIKAGAELTRHGELRKNDSTNSNHNNNVVRVKEKELSFLEKVYYFHTGSPLVKLVEHTIGYILFLMLFSYVAILEKTTTSPGWSELLLMLTVFGYFVAEVYQLVHVDASASAWARLEGYLWDFWNLFDILCISVFIVAVILRTHESTIEIGHLFYAFDVSLWTLRLIQVLYAHQVTGPYVVMIGSMLSDMFNFLIIIFIFLFSYGIAVTAILEPGALDSPQGFLQTLVQTVFHPYFHIHGEYFLNDPAENYTQFGTLKRNDYSEPIAFIYLAAYLLVANILLLNLLVAVFGKTYEDVTANVARVWKYQRFSLIVEYAERRTFLFPPFSLISHLLFFGRWFLSVFEWSGVQKPEVENVLIRLSPSKRAKQLQLQELESSCSIKVIQKMGKQNSARSDDDKDNDSVSTSTVSSFNDMCSSLLEENKKTLEEQRTMMDEQRAFLAEISEQNAAFVTLMDENRSAMSRMVEALEKLDNDGGEAAGV